MLDSVRAEGRFGFVSGLFTLEQIADQKPAWRFNVPIYQRLYAWGEEQRRALLADLLRAFEQKEPYYLGGVLLVESVDASGDRTFDLVDGQQRFTTLWLLSAVLRDALEPFLAVEIEGRRTPRLRFAIREPVNRLFAALARGNSLLESEDETASLRDAYGWIKSSLEGRESEALSGFAEFVFRHVRLAITTVPGNQGVDLNQLFEAINTSGVQLQQHEILKARLLEVLDQEERGRYAMLWRVCADMNGYVERNLGIAIGQAMDKTKAAEAKAEIAKLHRTDELIHAHAVRELINHTSESLTSTTLANILSADAGAAEGVGKLTGAPTGYGSDKDKRKHQTRSIIGFPLFLLHVLRVWLHKHGRDDLPQVRDQNLLSLFEDHFPADRDNVRLFIDLLWRLRVLFDRNVVKWVDDGDGEVHRIAAVTDSEEGLRSLSRAYDQDTHPGLALLQSMLYHSQEITTHYWLTPLLGFMHEYPSADAGACFAYLRHLDNHLLGGDLEGSLVERTHEFLRNQSLGSAPVHEQVLDKKLGIGFSRYWFYKLEFVLWFQETQQSARRPEWKNFRVTARNSIEHIAPQNPRDTAPFSDGALDDFGNLALVTSDMNSGFGNVPFLEKKSKYEGMAKKRASEGKGSYSLKMDLIYENDKWNEEVMAEHRKDMIRRLTAYWEG